MKANNFKRTLPFLLAALLGLVGCELLVDFDRTKIPVDTSDSGPTPDASLDVQTDVVADVAAEAAPDAAADASDAADAADADDASDADDSG